MPIIEWAEPVRIEKLRRELTMAGVVADVLGTGWDAVEGYATGVTVELADAAQGSVLTMVLVAHDPTMPDATEVQKTANTANVADFYANYAAMIADLDAIEQRLTDSKARVDAAIAEGQTTPPANVNQVWQKTRLALQELSDAEQQSIRLTRVVRRTVQAARATLDS